MNFIAIMLLPGFVKKGHAYKQKLSYCVFVFAESHSRVFNSVFPKTGKTPIIQPYGEFAP